MEIGKRERRKNIGEKGEWFAQSGYRSSGLKTMADKQIGRQSFDRMR